METEEESKNKLYYRDSTPDSGRGGSVRCKNVVGKEGSIFNGNLNLEAVFVVGSVFNTEDGGYVGGGTNPICFIYKGGIKNGSPPI